MSIFLTEKIDTDMIEQLKKQDQLEAIMVEFAQRFPGIKRRLIDERDTYPGPDDPHRPRPNRGGRRRGGPHQRHHQPDPSGPIP